MHRIQPVLLPLWLAVGAAVLAGGCSRQREPAGLPADSEVTGSHAAERQARASLQLTSSAFAEGESLPVKHTCDGENVSPPLTWSGVPEDAKCLALVCEDPDAPAGTWVHWVAFGIPATVTDLPEGVPAEEAMAAGGTQGMSDFGEIGYGGPCPPKGKPHRYVFTLYALSAEPALSSSATKADLDRAIRENLVAEGALTGTYQRR